MPSCVSCRANLSDTAKFCDQCGAKVEPPAAATRVHYTRDGERRQLTVLFCDLVGSTELAAKMDPEAYNAVLTAYYDDVRRAIEAHDGHIYQLLGDGVLALFGYPDVHEDSARRAVAAALEAQENLASGTARIGIHTGWVVLNEIENAGTHAVGSATNVAARVQTAAEPDEVLLSDVTHQLVRRYFDIEDAGMHNLKGLPAPVGLYRAVALRASAAVDPAGTLVGRDAEVARIVDGWSAVLEGGSSVVVLRGEPGIGKSQVLRSAVAELASAGAVRLHLDAIERSQHTPFAPIIALLHSLAAAYAGDTDAERVAAMLDDAGRHDPTHRGAIARVMGVELGEPDSTYLLPSEARRTATIDALVSWVLALGDRSPVVVTVEDLHWLDPSSVEVLEAVRARIDDHAVMVLATTRPEHRSAFLDRAEVLDLSGLDHGAVAAMVREVVGGDATEQLIEDIWARSEGIPLFVEELARAHGQVALGDAESVPVTLHDLLASRFSELVSGREVAQVASVLGREVDLGVLAAMLGVDVDGLVPALDELAEAGLFRHEVGEDSSVGRFHHALLRDSAYESLLHKQRRELHEAAARSIREVTPQVAAARPELLGYHWGEAGDARRSIRYWTRAGELASGRSAFSEALTHYDHALEHVVALDDDAAATELNIQNARKQLLLFLGGYASDAYVGVVARVKELGEQLRGSDANFSGLSDVWGVALSRGDIAASHDAAEQLLSLAAGSDKQSKRLWAEQTMVASLTNMGRFEEAFARGQRVADVGREQPDLLADPMARQALLQVRIYLGLAASQLDRFDEARWVAEEALEIADDEHGNAVDRAVALTNAVVVYTWLQEFDRLAEIVDALRQSATETGFPLHAGWADIYGGWAMAKTGDVASGLDTLLAGIECHVRLDQRLGLGQYLALLAEVQLLGGEPDAALMTISNALEMPDEQTWHRPEMHRIRALVLTELDPAAAEEAFEQAASEAERLGNRLVLRRLAHDRNERGVPT